MSELENALELDVVIGENRIISLESYPLKILSYLGLFLDVHHFKVEIQRTEKDNSETKEFGLLRVGGLNSGLQREIELRKQLQEYGMIAKILAVSEQKSVSIDFPALGSEVPDRTPNPIEVVTDSPESDAVDDREKTAELGENLAAYLEEEYYPEQDLYTDASGTYILLLTGYPEPTLTLESWLQENHSAEEILSLVIQICQCFSHIFQQKWCSINLNTKQIEVNRQGKPIKLFDLTDAYPLDYKPQHGLSGDYYAPELALAPSIHEGMSCYTTGALLYQAFHRMLPDRDRYISPEIQPIPRIYQILKIALSPVPEERFSLAQLRDLLVATRKEFRQVKTRWNIASHSTVGLSTSRLQNEDNYGVKQQQLSDFNTLLLGVVADGMGGMSQGEIASQIAVQTFLKEPIPENLSTAEQCNTWLVDICQKTNQAIAEKVQDGGTTLSVVLAINHQLTIAHVGDSRIYHIHGGEIGQLSEDHSLVALLVASGEITEEESWEHPDRNVLLKSLGSTRNLSNGYVQNLNRTVNKLSIDLENNDIIILCSDGVWDLVQKTEMFDIFSHVTSLQAAVDRVIEKVIAKGASDNATLLALQCQIESAY
jgi:serine/threonine protein phosphatase PrpC